MIIYNSSNYCKKKKRKNKVETKAGFELPSKSSGTVMKFITKEDMKKNIKSTSPNAEEVVNPLTVMS